MTHGPEIFLTELFAADDLVSAIHNGVGGVVRTFAEIRDNLGAFSAINLNPLTRGEQPKRKRVAVKFGISYWRQLSFLTRSAELMLLVCGASGGLYGVFRCETWSPKKLTNFAVQTVKLGGEVVEQIPAV